MVKSVSNNGVTYIFALDHRAAGHGHVNDRGASAQERTFQDPTVLAMVIEQAKLDPNAEIHIVAPDNFKADQSQLPSNVTLHVVKDAGESRNDYYDKYDAKIESLATQAKKQGHKTVGMSPHYDALSYAGMSPSQVANGTSFGGAHVITGTKHKEASKQLAERIANGSVKTAESNGIATRNSNGKNIRSHTQDNGTLNGHEKHFDSIVLLEVAAQHDAIGKLFADKGVPEVSHADSDNPRAGPGYSKEVAIYTKWLNHPKSITPDEQVILNKIADKVPLKNVPAEVANNIAETRMFEQLALDMDTHAQNDLGYKRETTTQGLTNIASQQGTDNVQGGQNNDNLGGQPPAVAPPAKPKPATNTAASTNENNDFWSFLKGIPIIGQIVGLLEMFMGVFEGIKSFISDPAGTLGNLFGGNKNTPAATTETAASVAPQPAPQAPSTTTEMPSTEKANVPESVVGSNGVDTDVIEPPSVPTVAKSQPAAAPSMS